MIARQLVRLPRGDRPYGLTDCEVRVLELTAEGKTNREIPGQLFTSVRTTDYHLLNLCKKMGVKNRGRAVYLALRCGLISVPLDPASS